MPIRVRVAAEADLEQIVALTTIHRHRLAEWSPAWWRVAPGADEAHPQWLHHLLHADGPVFRVADDGIAVVGCAVALPQRDQWFIDDVAVAGDARWQDAGTMLLAAIPERPALTCVATADEARMMAMESAGLNAVSTYWIGPTQPGETGTRSLRPGVTVAPGPRHTFGGALDPIAEGALSFEVADGFVVGSPSVHAPPIYDPGGTVCVVDRIVGTERDRLLGLAAAAAAARGDVLLAVVCGEGDAELDQALEARGFDPTVIVYSWPRGPH